MDGSPPDEDIGGSASFAANPLMKRPAPPSGATPAYSPTLGRFLQTDPIGYDDQVNLYAYVADDPLNNRDPDGQVIDTIWDAANVALGVASAVSNAREGNWGAAAVDTVGVVVDGAATVVPFIPGGAGTAIKAARGVERAVEIGRAGRQARLREMANDTKLGRADRGWIKQEMNSIARGQRSNIRNPPGKDLAHQRGREAAKGYDHQHSKLQDRDLHRTQHKFDDFGRRNRERPLD